MEFTTVRKGLCRVWLVVCWDVRTLELVPVLCYALDHSGKDWTYDQSLVGATTNWCLLVMFIEHYMSCCLHSWIWKRENVFLLISLCHKRDKGRVRPWKHKLAHVLCWELNIYFYWFCAVCLSFIFYIFMGVQYRGSEFLSTSRESRVKIGVGFPSLGV